MFLVDVGVMLKLEMVLVAGRLVKYTETCLKVTIGTSDDMLNSLKFKFTRTVHVIL